MKPQFPYNGNQITHTSDRIILNSKSDSIFLFSNQYINFSSNEGIHFNTEKDVILNSNQIKLGLDATEPLVKGDQLKNILSKLFNTLDSIGEQLSNAMDSNGNPIPTVTTAGNTLVKSIKRITTLLEKLNSTQNFTL